MEFAVKHARQARVAILITLCRMSCGTSRRFAVPPTMKKIVDAFARKITKNKARNFGPEKSGGEFVQVAPHRVDAPFVKLLLQLSNHQ
jgi:hypothetical protein